ncbi:MAG: glycosyltransferase [Planctomycetia bacterium]|nr:glycosyltransferase [Planctomycetia bacterium]
MIGEPDYIGPSATALLDTVPAGPGCARDPSDGDFAPESRRPLRRLLLIAYQFPPVGGAGVQRVTKFVKCLPQFGWQANVLTVENPSVPVTDHSLLADVPADTLVARAATWEPGYSVKSLVLAEASQAARSPVSRLKSAAKRALRRLANLCLQPDPQVLWAPNAIRLGRSLLARERYDAILASGPPFSTLLVGRALSLSSGLPLVVDYRDEWGLANSYMENRQFGRLASWVQQRQQAGILKSARAIIATTRASTDHLDHAARKCASDAQAHCIFNGFDRDDFPDDHAPSMDQRTDSPLRLVYVGTLWKMTSLAPLAGALRVLANRVSDLSRRLELVVAGRRTTEEQEVLTKLNAEIGCLREVPYLEHRDAVALMQSADLLLVSLSGLPGAERILPAKVFEYLAVGRQIMAITPPGELWDLLERHSNADLFDPADANGIADHLEFRLECRSSGLALPEAFANLDGLDRVSQSRQLANILDCLVGDAATATELA